MKKADIVLALVVVGLVLLAGVVLPDGKSDTVPVIVIDEAIEASTDFYSISAKYPVDPRDMKSEMRTYVEYAVNEMREAWRDGGEVEQSERELSRMYPDRPAPHYELAIGYSVRESPKLDTRTYVFEHYQFTGGAHGNTTLATFTFGKNGKIAIEDILDFDNGNDILLTKELARTLSKTLATSTTLDAIYDGLGLSYLNADGSFSPEKCQCDGFFFPSNFQNMIVTDTGLTFVMGQYQVAPYVVGMPEASFTWSELASYLTPLFKSGTLEK
jgi:hypothetical protein